MFLGRESKLAEAAVREFFGQVIQDNSRIIAPCIVRPGQLFSGVGGHYTGYYDITVFTFNCVDGKVFDVRGYRGSITQEAHNEDWVNSIKTVAAYGDKISEEEVESWLLSHALIPETK